MQLRMNHSLTHSLATIIMFQQTHNLMNIMSLQCIGLTSRCHAVVCIKGTDSGHSSIM